MKLCEFKAWLEGFSDAMGDAPTPEQWAKIKAKLAQVDEGYGGIPAHPFVQPPFWQTPLIGGGPMRTDDPVIRPGTVVCGDPPGSIGNMGVSNTGGVQ